MFHSRPCSFAEIASSGDLDTSDDNDSDGDISDEEDGDEDDGDDPRAEGFCFFQSWVFPFFTRLFKPNF